jgi:hypothetical protein
MKLSDLETAEYHQSRTIVELAELLRSSLPALT